MLEIVIPEIELFNDSTNEFYYVKEQKLVLEHSLVSVSKWEAKWNRPFISKEPMTKEQNIDYIKCMTITQNVNPIVYYAIDSTNMKKIADYIDSPMTATTFRNDKNSKKKSEIITSELIYYWMIALNIPFECQKWHLNRLLTLIKVCSIKNGPTKKMSKNETLRSYASLNAARRKSMGSSG